MRDPINLSGFTSEVVYPASIYSLERHENFAYERFAYNVFREGVSALHEQNLPIRLVVKFVIPNRYPAWTINASVTKNPGSEGFTIELPELLPPMFVLFCHIVTPRLDPKSFREASEFRDLIQKFFDLASAMVRDYKSDGLATAIRNAFANSSVDLQGLQKAADAFDWLSFLVANHEIAHIYIRQLTEPPDDGDSAAFEYLADIISSEWQFRHFIYNTPTTPEYLNMRGLASRAEALFENCKMCLDSHFSLLLLTGMAGAQQSGGRFHFDSGKTHPGGFGRFWLQTSWLLGAIEAHSKAEIGPDYYDAIQDYFSSCFDHLCEAGLINKNALWQVVDEDQVALVVRAAEIAEKRGIEEVRFGIEFLKSRLSTAAKMRTMMN